MVRKLIPPPTAGTTGARTSNESLCIQFEKLTRARRGGGRRAAVSLVDRDLPARFDSSGGLRSLCRKGGTRLLD